MVEQQKNFKTHDIRIPKEYWLGDKTIEYEIPWLTPQSIFRLNELLKMHFTVLEIGSGGSTLFFTKRCKTVFSIETDQNWHKKVQSILEEKKITNCNLHLCETMEEILTTINKLDCHFDCIMIDPHKRELRSKKIINRDKIFITITENISQKSVIILDNYTSRFFFTYLRKLSNQQIIEKFLSPDWIAEEYNDKHWHGSGTKILYNL